MTKAHRILLSINTSWNIYNFRKPLIEALQKEGYEVITVAPEDHYSDRLREFTTYYPITMSNDGASPLRDIWLFWQYLSLLYKTKPSAMLGYTVKPNIYGSLACRILGIPIINNVSGLGTVFIKQSWLTSLVKWLYHLAFKSSSHIFFQNQADHQLFIEHKLVDATKTSVIPGSGIDLERFAPRDSAPKDHLEFLLVARMLWDKGVGEYVEAARIVKQQYPQVKFTLIGPGGVHNRTAIPASTLEQWQQEGIVSYLGEMHDVRDQLAACDALVLPSYREGMSRALLEGLAMGKPLIATNVPGCKDMIDEGKNGFLCELKDPESLANAMIRFIELSAEEQTAMGKASRHKAEVVFDQQIVFEAYLRKLRALLY